MCYREVLRSEESTKAVMNAWHLSLSISIICVNIVARNVINRRTTCVHEEATRRATIAVQKVPTMMLDDSWMS
jgi:hypothetical protein